MNGDFPSAGTDALLLQALLYAGGLADGAALQDVIALGDGIRDTLFTAEELQSSFAFLMAAGFVREVAGRFVLMGAARGLAKKEGSSLAQHGAEIEAFLAAAAESGTVPAFSDPDWSHPELTDERIAAATRAYLEGL